MFQLIKAACSPSSEAAFFSQLYPFSNKIGTLTRSNTWAFIGDKLVTLFPTYHRHYHRHFGDIYHDIFLGSFLGSTLFFLAVTLRCKNSKNCLL